MKITSVPVASAVQSYNEIKRKSSVAFSGVMGRDQVEFSSDAKILSAALRAVKEVPDVRQARVVEIRGMIENGTYSVEGSQIAKKVLQSAMLDGVSK